MATAALLTIPETASRLRLHRSGVYRRIAAGQLAAINVALPGERPTLRISERDIAEYIAACAIPAPVRRRRAA